jgi:hypothetical protein
VNRRFYTILRSARLAALGAGLVGLAACQDEPQPLTLDDLTPDETRYVTRFVQLERARAVALADPESGAALLDSLAAAWGDSAAFEARAQLPAGPVRSAAVHELLAGILRAERDSLIIAPSPDRLAQPLPEPEPEPPIPAPASAEPTG